MAKRNKQKTQKRKNATARDVAQDVIYHAELALNRISSDNESLPLLEDEFSQINKMVRNTSMFQEVDDIKRLVNILLKKITIAKNPAYEYKALEPYTIEEYARKWLELTKKSMMKSLPKKHPKHSYYMDKLLHAQQLAEGDLDWDQAIAMKDSLKEIILETTRLHKDYIECSRSIVTVRKFLDEVPVDHPNRKIADNAYREMANMTLSFTWDVSLFRALYKGVEKAFEISLDEWRERDRLKEYSERVQKLSDSIKLIPKAYLQIMTIVLMRHFNLRVEREDVDWMSDLDWRKATSIKVGQKEIYQLVNQIERSLKKSLSNQSPPISE
jgi:hypothetical protein